MKKFSVNTYQKRRNRLKKSLGKGRILFFGNDNSPINFKDNWYPFRQDSTFLYYFGLNLPGLNAVIDVDNDSEILFGNELSIDDIIWTGRLPSLKDLASEVGISEVRPTIELIKYISADIHFLPVYRAEHSILLARLFNKKTWKIEKHHSKALVKAVVKQRSIKSTEEIKEMDRAVRISGEMQLHVIKNTKPGMKEHDLVGLASRIAHHYNVPFAYPPIMTRDGQTLHNHYYGNILEEGDMVLFDGGCESEAGYAGDLTRTFPVSRTFSPLQRDFYQIVYAAFADAVNALAPGILFKDIHRLASVTLLQGLKDLGFVRGDVEEAVNEGVHTLFFQCGLGHMIGLDVHDMENLGEERVGYTEKVAKSKAFGWKSLRLGRALKTGFAVTVEPGIYIIPELIKMRQSEGLFKDFVDYPKLEGILNFGGIRLEDNFIITESGSQLLGGDMPKTAAEIEALRT